jgi:hypothetical protein
MQRGHEENEMAPYHVVVRSGNYQSEWTVQAKDAGEACDKVLCDMAPKGAMVVRVEQAFFQGHD